MWFHLTLWLENIRILAHIKNKVDTSIYFVLFFWKCITFSWFHFKLCLDNTRILAWIEKLVAERIGFVMFLWDEITLCIFWMVSFQTLLIKPEGVCMYKTGCSKTIGFVMLLWHEPILCMFEVVPFQILLITLLDLLHVYKSAFQNNCFFMF